jgi:hypothetical protein
MGHWKRQTMHGGWRRLLQPLLRNSGRHHAARRQQHPEGSGSLSCSAQKAEPFFCMSRNDGLRGAASEAHPVLVPNL